MIPRVAAVAVAVGVAVAVAVGFTHFLHVCPWIEFVGVWELRV